MNATLELVAISTGPNAKSFLIKRGREELGVIERLTPRAGEIHPWKAFRGVGWGQKYVGAFYGPNGKAEAIAAAAGEKGGAQ